MKNKLNEKQFFIIKKAKYIGYQIHDNKSYDLTTAVKKLLALDTLNEDRERISHYLQEVTDKGLLPLVLTDEVEEKEQSEMPF